MGNIGILSSGIQLNHTDSTVGVHRLQTADSPFVKPGRGWIGTMTEVVVVIVVVDVTTTMSVAMSCFLPWGNN